VSSYVEWNDIPAWNVVDEKHQTPDLSSLIQDVIDRGGWASENSMAFIITGTGTRIAESYNGENAAAPTLHVEYSVGPAMNEAPIVEAGNNQTISFPVTTAVLDATVSDDGLPTDTLVIAWSQISGPAVVLFDDSTSVDTTATFDTIGEYVLQLEVDDGEYVTTDMVTITVTEPDEQAPTVPGNLTATPISANQINLNWDASTDNIAVTGYEIYRNGVSAGTTLESPFIDSGLQPSTSYDYTIEAYDAADNRSALSNLATATTLELSIEIEVSIAGGTDDAEESVTGRMNLTSSDLELVDDGALGTQTVGLRFNGIQIPQGATITNAYIEFETDETGSGPTSLMITAQDIDDAPTFTTAVNNISGRFTVSSYVEWNDIPAWNVVDEKHQTPDLSSLIQDVIDGGGWASENSMAFIITGTGTRIAESYNGEQMAAPLLHVEFIE